MGQVYTAGGNVVTTPNIVLATDSPIHENLLVHARQSPYRSYVTCLKIDPVHYSQLSLQQVFLFVTSKTRPH